MAGAQAPQLRGDRGGFCVERVDHGQRDRDLLAGGRRQPDRFSHSRLAVRQ